MKQSKKHPTPNETTELDNFTELTRKLLRVSKAEIDVKDTNKNYRQTASKNNNKIPDNNNA